MGDHDHAGALAAAGIGGVEVRGPSHRQNLFDQSILGMIFTRAEMLEIAEANKASAAAPDAEEAA